MPWKHYDHLTGKAFAGPASLPASNSNVLATLYLEADDDNNLWIEQPAGVFMTTVS